jgi:hypothetical protein
LRSPSVRLDAGKAERLSTSAQQVGYFDRLLHDSIWRRSELIMRRRAHLAVLLALVVSAWALVEKLFIDNNGVGFAEPRRTVAKGGPFITLTFRDPSDKVISLSSVSVTSGAHVWRCTDRRSAGERDYLGRFSAEGTTASFRPRLEGRSKLVG